MSKQYLITSLLILSALSGGAVNAEFPPLPEEAEQQRPEYPSATNRWQGNYPELGNALPHNPWGSSGPIIREQSEKQFVTPKQQFPELDYSPYEEGRKRLRLRNRLRGGAPETGWMPQTRGAYPGYGSYYPPGGYGPYEGYGRYPRAGWPGQYGGPWTGGGLPFYGGGPRNGRGGGFPFSPFNW